VTGSHVSLTAWATPRSLSERAQEGKSPAGALHIIVPHGTGTRVIVVEVTLDECLALCANAADAARLLGRAHQGERT
jgi:hypothetical protein